MLIILSIWSSIIDIDRKLFVKLNSKWTNSFFDELMPFLRNSSHWIPLYLFLFFFVVLNFKKYAWWWCLLFICTVALTDLIGTHVFKHTIERVRPCNDLLMIDQVRLVLNRCSGGYSFISNHAANHFGMAAFFYFTFRNILPKWAWIGFAWAGLIAYAQVYIGVHYPLDVIAGGLLGLMVGKLTSTIFNNRFGFTIFDNQPTMVT